MSRRPDVPHRKPVLLCWSGGKDAAWTLHALRQRDDVEVVALLSSITTDYGRSSMQGVRREVLQAQARSEEHTSELQSLMRISYAVFCLKKQNKHEYVTII